MFVAIEDVSEIGVELDGSYKRMSSLCIVTSGHSAVMDATSLSFIVRSVTITIEKIL